MSDTPDRYRVRAFAIEGVPGSYATRLVHRAVLAPLYGAGAMQPGDAQTRALMHLVASWRARVYALAAAREAAGASDDAAPDPAWTANRVTSMLNCPPSSFIPTGFIGRPCGRTTYCPHCWGREAIASWRAIDARLFPPRKKTRRAPFAGLIDPGGDLRPRSPRKTRACPYSVVLRTVVYRIRKARAGDSVHPFERWFAYHRDPAPGKKARPERPRLQAPMLAAGAVGGLEVITCGYRRAAGRPAGRQITVRQLLLVPPKRLNSFLRSLSVRELPEAIVKSRAARLLPLVVRRAPSRRGVVALVARTWRYPADYLRCPAPHLLDLLGGHAGRRLNTRFGMLWGHKSPPG